MTKNENDNYTVVLGGSVISHLKKLFPSITDDDDVWATKRELRMDYDNHGKILDVTFVVFAVVGATYVNLLVNAKTKFQAIECLESIQWQLFDSKNIFQLYRTTLFLNITVIKFIQN